MKEANQEKGAPSDIKKGIQKDASVLGRTIWERLHLSKPHPAENIVFVRIHNVLRRTKYAFGVKAFQNGEGLIPVVFNRDDDVHVLLDPLFDPLMGRFPVGPFFLEHFPIGFHEDRGGWEASPKETSAGI